jgi:EAL domain-containing protein (putative c-di-GMP-specific phosphodiesterase class I)/GGDEF domain-containing protein
MLEKKFRRCGLSSFNFKKTQWYQTIRAENRHYKYNLLLFAFSAAAVVPVALFAADLSRGDLSLSMNYLASFAVAASLVATLVFSRSVRTMMRVCLVLVFAALPLTLYLPAPRYAFVFPLIVFPLVAIELRGTRRGFWWYGLFLSSFVVMVAFDSLPGFPRWAIAAGPAEAVEFALVSAIVFAFSLLSERRQESLIDRLTNLLVFEDATGLPNKDALLASIAEDKAYLFAIVKIENFSNLVALFGYDFSELIEQFASQKFRKYEVRFGYKTFQLKSNEFALLSRTEGPVTIAEAAQRLTETVKALELEALPWERDKIRLVFRVGGAVIAPGDLASPLSKADIALKRAERGHSAITIYEDGTGEKENAYDYVMKFTELVNNREEGAFRAVFQPVFNSSGTEIQWYEALLRVKKQDGEYASVYPYLAVAKSTGFYQFLTDFILRASVDAILEYDVDVSINISINDIVRPDFILLVDEVYERIRERKGRIIFEILESDELVELDKCIWFIDYISRYGFKIAIDDFGTGYSNYCSLISLPIDIVKIDGSLIRQIKTDENARLLVEGIVHFCARSNKKTVAEFVEDIHVFDSLKDLNIDYLQGYYLSEPAAIASCPCPSPRA